MLHHISIAVSNPLRVAKVLAEVLNGRFFAFPVFEGSYIVLASDSHGTAIEVLPMGAEMIPGEAEAEISQGVLAPHFNAVHAAISVSMSQEELQRIGQRERWLVRLCDRGPFKVVEFWVENMMLLELLPPLLAAQYCQFMTPENYEAFLATAELAPVS